MSERSLTRSVPAHETFEGGGFLVHRPFPTPDLEAFDPFLLLDEMGPSELGPGEAKGAPDHPHRGFETVTYMIAGRMDHRDSQGNSGSIGPGDVQWMTAGAGVVHSEMPGHEILERGGLMHGFQLWVNLPRRDKMMRPRYQELPSAKMPIVTSEDGRVRVRVIAGESLGAQAAIDTRTPIVYLHFSISSGGSIVQPLESTYNGFIYVFAGAATFGGSTATRGTMLILGNDGDGVRLENRAAETLEALLIAGVPLREPVARYGPFVMNTKGEILQAIDDYRSGRMGEIQ